jgi:alpha-L-fucosidase 2
MNMKKIFLLSLSVALYMGAEAQTATTTHAGLTIWFDRQAPVTQYTSLNDKSAQNQNDWERFAFPLGNGSLGASILSNAAKDRIVLNEKSLWKGGPNTRRGAAAYWKMNGNGAAHIQEIRDAFEKGDKQKAGRLTAQYLRGTIPYYEPDSTASFGCFTTMGELYLSTGADSSRVSHFERILSLDNAMSTVSYSLDGVRYIREYFVSYPDQVMVIRLTASEKGKVNCALSYLPHPDATGTMQAEGTDGIIYRASLNNNGLRFAFRLRAEQRGGTVAYDGHQLTVSNADEAVLYLTAATDYKMNFNPDVNNAQTYRGEDPEVTTKISMDHACNWGYRFLKERHVADYTHLFSRVSLQLNPQTATADIPTDKRMDNYRKGRIDNFLEALYFQFGRYLIIAGSRAGDLPTNLQGLWSPYIDGPWHVDYHNNINIQMNYWPVCCTGLQECEQPLIDYIRLMAKPGEKTAHDVFGARGWTASISSNPFGFSAPVDSGDMAWNLCPMGGPWIATHLWEYYDFTRDREFLRTMGYPLLKGSAEFASTYLWKQKDGTYTAAPSTSPEHGGVDSGCTFAHAVAREILSDAISASRLLRLDARERGEWEAVLAKLAPYKIGRYGQLMEWAEDIDDPKDDHRHQNHLFGLYPGTSISTTATPQLAQAARVVLEHRGDFATGWSMGWKLNLWAHLDDGNHAYRLFGNLLKTGTLDNLWDSHPPFQIDGNFGGTSGVAEMLLQSTSTSVTLLPALPDAWKEGRVTGLCARGNFTVDITWKDGRLAEATLVSKSGARTLVRYGSSTLLLQTRKGAAYRLTMKGRRLAMSIVRK